MAKRLKKYIEENKVKYPADILEEGKDVTVVADRSRLATYKGDAQAFVKGLRTKGVL